MKRILKKMICVASVASVALFSCLTVSASTVTENQTSGNKTVTTSNATASRFDIVQAKKELENAHANERKELSQQESEDMYNRIQEIFNNQSYSQEEKDKLLEKEGVYRLITPTDNMITAASSAADIYMTAPQTFYNSSDGTWCMYAGGHWLNNNWTDGLGTNSDSDVGDAEKVGIHFYDTSGSFSNCVLLSDSYGQLNDQDGGHATTNHYTSTPGEQLRYGAFYNVQDRNIYGKYRGYYFSIYLHYSSSFKNYDGLAQFFYVHSGPLCLISGCSLSSSGISVTFSDGGSSYSEFGPVYTYGTHFSYK